MANFFPKFYLQSELPGGVAALYTNRLIQQIAGGLLGLFLPVFLFQKYQSINLVLLFYLVSFGVYLFLAAPGAMLASRLTFKRALIISVFGGAVYYFSFYLFVKHEVIIAYVEKNCK